MANTLPTSALICKDTLSVLQNSSAMATTVNRDYDKDFTNGKYDPGDTVNIKLPPRFQAMPGRTAVSQDIVVGTVPLKLNQWHIKFDNTNLERTLASRSYDKAIEAAAASMLTEIDRQGTTLAMASAFNIINAAGAAPNTQALAAAAAADVGAVLTEQAASRMDRFFALAPQPHANMLVGLSGMFNDKSLLSQQYKDGRIREAFGLGFMDSANMPRHTNGAGVGTNINGANQTGATLTINATAGIITKNTIVQLPGCFQVNPQTRESTGRPMTVIVTADMPAGSTSMPISPALVTSGNFQNCSASPTSGSPFVVQGAASTSYSANIAYHRDFLTMAMVDMKTPPPGSGAVAHQESMDGFTLKVTEYWDGNGDVMSIRMDALFGWAATYPSLAVRYPVL